ncbi:hypothetical protein ACTFIV_006315 [Dictyostelium citrinum]
MNDLNLSKLSLEESNDGNNSPSHPRQRIQFYQDESTTSPPLNKPIFEQQQSPQMYEQQQQSSLAQQQSSPQMNEQQQQQQQQQASLAQQQQSPPQMYEQHQIPSTTQYYQSPPPPQMYQQQQQMYQQPQQSYYNSNNSFDNQTQQNPQQSEVTSLEFGIDLPTDSGSNISGITNDSIQTGSWFDDIVNYQKQYFNSINNKIITTTTTTTTTTQQHSEDIDNYLKDHIQNKMKENQEQKQYTHPINMEYGMDQSVLSSSTLIFNRHDQFNKSNLPNGFLLSPFYHPISTPTSYDYHPPQCDSCYSYVNIYCKLNKPLEVTSDSKSNNNSNNNKSKKGNTSSLSWTCSICLNENFIDDGKSGVRNILDVVKGLGWWSTNHYKSVFSSETYDIKIKKRKSYKSKSIGSLIDNGIDDDVVDENEINSENNNNDNNNNGKISNNNNSSYIFIIDENISTTDLREINESIRLLTKELPDKSNVGIITFSKNISIFEMNSINNDEKSKESLLGFNSAKLVSGGNSLSQQKHQLKRRRKLYLETIEDNKAIDHDKDSQVNKERTPKLNSILTSLLETFENNGDQVVYESKPISLGVAIESAMSLIGDEVENSSRFFVFLNGSPDYGPGSIPKIQSGLFVNASSIGTNNSDGSNYDDNGSGFNLSTEEHAQLNNAYQYYEHLGEKAYNYGIAIDITLIGYNNFESKVISKLCKPSGFMTSSLEASHGRNGQAVKGERAKILFSNMNNAIIKNSGIFGQLDIHTHDSVSLTHLIGPTINNSDIKNNRLIQSFNKHLENDEDQLISTDQVNDRYTSFIISNLQQDICFSVYYNFQEDIPLDYIHFQFVIHLIKANGVKISRVITKRFKITGNFDRFLSSLDLKVTTTLLAKKLILQSLKNQSSNIQFELDKQVKKICLSCSKIEKGWFRKSIIIPDIIKNSFLKLIYKIRRGLLFGSIIQNNDDLVIHQNDLLNSNFIDCQKLLLPKLFQLNKDSNQFNNIPLDICSINPNVILILDCFTNIYVMIGSGMTDATEKLQLLQDHIDHTTHQRIPSPCVMKFDENGHDIRWMKSILSSSESYPIQERINIIKEIYPEYKDLDINQEFLKRFDDPFSSSDTTPAQYEREITTNLL